MWRVGCWYCSQSNDENLMSQIAYHWSTVDFFDRDLHTRTAVTCLTLHQLSFLVCSVAYVFLFLWLLDITVLLFRCRQTRGSWFVGCRHWRTTQSTGVHQWNVFLRGDSHQQWTCGHHKRSVCCLSCCCLRYWVTSGVLSHCCETWCLWLTRTVSIPSRREPAGSGEAGSG